MEALLGSSVPGGRVWPWQGKGPSPAFSLPTSSGFLRFVQCPTGPVERQRGHCGSPQSSRMGLTGRAESSSSNCCFRSPLMWIWKLLEHGRQRGCIGASCAPLMTAGLPAQHSHHSSITVHLLQGGAWRTKTRPKPWANSSQGRWIPRAAGLCGIDGVSWQGVGLHEPRGSLPALGIL